MARWHHQVENSQVVQHHVLVVRPGSCVVRCFKRAAVVVVEMQPRSLACIRVKRIVELLHLRIDVMLYIRKDTCYRRFKRVIRLLPYVLQIKERQIGIVLQLECVDSSLEFVMTVKEPLRHAPDKAEFPDLTENRL